MTYSYKCEDDHNTDLIQSIKEDTPKAIICETCGKTAVRDWGNGSSLILPENFKAMSEFYNTSGKSRVYY
jgi:predicted nucleic acid-binding Zn ribbon protein